MIIIKRISTLITWSLLVIIVLSSCAYRAALERETKREVTATRELEEAQKDNEKQLRTTEQRQAQLKELKEKVAKIEKEIDAIQEQVREVKKRKKEEERKIKKVYAKRDQVEKRNEKLNKIRKEFDLEINRLTAEKERKEKQRAQLQQENSE